MINANFGEGFPYTNFHDMNLDWMIKIAKDFLDQYSHIQEIIDTGETTLENKYNELEALLQTWYDTHSSDIANQLADALTAIQSELTTSVASFGTQAHTIGQAVIDSIPDDYTALSYDVDSVRKSLNIIPGGEFYEFVTGKYLEMTGTTIDINNPTTGSGWGYCVIECEWGDTFHIEARAVTNPPTYAFINSSGSVLLRSPTDNYLVEGNVTAPVNSAYLVVNNTYEYYTMPVVYLYDGNLATVKEGKAYPFENGKYYTIDNTNKINLSSPSTGSGWATCVADCTEGDIFIISARSVANPCVIAFIDSSGNVLKLSKVQKVIERFRITAPANSANLVVTNFNNWYATPYCYKEYPNRTYYIVDKSGNGDFSSLTAAINNSSVDLVVKAGDYDIVAEYKAEFGTGIFNNISDSYDGIGVFKYGLYISRRKITFEPGAKVLCDLTGVLSVDSSHRFSVFNMAVDAILEGAYCEGIGVWYVVHDDFGIADEYYTNIIRNCVLTGTVINTNIIGGGCRNHSTNIVENTYMSNHVNNSITCRYHNYDNANAQPTVIIRNCRANGKIQGRYYGSQTKKMLFMAHNNSTGAGVETAPETAGSTTNNVTMIAWANIIE